MDSPVHSQDEPYRNRRNIRPRLKRTKRSNDEGFIKFIRRYLPRFDPSLLRFLDSWFLKISIGLFVLWMVGKPLHSAFRTTANTGIYCYNHPSTCTWSTAETFVYCTRHPIKCKNFYIENSSDASSKSEGYYEMQQHDEQFKYMPNGNQQACTIEEDVFSLSLVPMQPDIFLWPEQVENATIAMIKTEQYLPGGISFRSLTLDLKELMDLIALLRKTYRDYLHRWLATSNDINRVFDETASQIKFSIDRFEKAVKSRKAHHRRFPWAGSSLLISYQENRRAYKEVQTIKSIHMRQRRFIHKGSIDVIQAGSKVSKVLTAIDLQTARVESSSKTIMGEIENLLSSMPTGEYSDFYLTLYWLYHGEAQKAIFEKARNKRDILTTIISGSETIKSGIQQSLRYCDGLTTNWNLLPQKESMKCFFPGVPVFGHSIDMDEISVRDWIDQINRWCNSRGKFAKHVKKRIGDFMETLGQG